MCSSRKRSGSIGFHVVRPFSLFSQSYLNYSAIFYQWLRHALTHYDPLVGIEMSLCIEDIMIVTPTEEIAHIAVIKDGWASNQEEMQSPEALMSSIVK